MTAMKITVIGAGNVGATCAQRIAEGDLGDVVLVDIIEGLPQGKALDLLEAAPVMGHSRSVVGANGYDETTGSDVVVMTAGLARKPGMSRDDLQKMNAEIVEGAITEAHRRSPGAIFVMVTNPLDIMCEVAYRVVGGDPSRVFGMAGVLDSARFRAFIALELGVAMEDVQAMVLGGHGDTMVPLPRFSTVSGISIVHLLPAERIEALAQRTRDGGAEIVGLLKTGSAYYAPAAATFQMVEAVVRDKKRILPVAARLSGQYGIDGQYLGVPAKLGAGGIEEIIELPLTDGELAELRRSAEHVRAGVEALG
ncbi:MAG: malate dehydrogenase [Armatimonadetes bacterium]|nr:malate dehydrogenase [Armatimonadota bacterium]MDI9600911.1 malate dehydrogenase [Acidobacteriota bacterium]NLN88747.1 malate dehydrogenase [candidate division WS1 bacterium]